MAFDTSTEVMSVAVQRRVVGQASALWQYSGPGGARTSATLIPVIQDLMAQAGLEFAELDAIVFGNGPGSFTGLRTACSVAQGLAFGAKVKVLPIDTLLCLAEEARAGHAVESDSWQVMALLDARMDEMYAACYSFERGQWTQTQDFSLIRPQDAVCARADTLVGNVFTAYGSRIPLSAQPRLGALPGACALLRLAPKRLAAGAAVRADQALPLYIRDKVAQTTLERAALKAVL